MKRIPIFPVLLLTTVTMLALSGCAKDNAESAQAAGSKEVPAVTVSVLELQPMEFDEIIDVTGTIASPEDVMVPTDEGGRVLNWKVPLGAHVRTGQVIVQLDSAIVRSTFDAAMAQFNIAQTNYEKQKNVYEQQGISELQLKTLQYQRDAARAQMEMSRARLERTSIKSPINGVLNARLVEAGEMSAPGAPIAHVVNIDRLKIQAGIPERYSSSFAQGDQVKFTVDAFPGQAYTGTIRFVGAAVNKDNRSIPVEVDIAGHKGQLKPDMIAKMKIKLGGKAQSIVVPEDYVSKTEKNEFVAYVEVDGVAHERKVTIGASSRGNLLIAEGLSAGDRLITLGHQNVAEGQRVIVKN
ncbi:MAG: efflux RND transporter periplasmic adaptor subunit [Bacteroidetes bacterium]|nr:efflux RND transporter periplasmic adaptor subunit [Bacteroidota bacterium]